MLAMPDRPALGLLLLCCLFVSAGAAVGAVYSFLDQAPMRYFNAEDTRLMSENIDAVLANPADNVSLGWRNNSTSSNGEAVSVRSFEHQGMRCRRLHIDNHANGADARTTADMCDVEGVWKVLRLPK